MSAATVITVLAVLIALVFAVGFGVLLEGRRWTQAAHGGKPIQHASGLYNVQVLELGPRRPAAPAAAPRAPRPSVVKLHRNPERV